jgi:type I restriction enzyme, S subunit
VTPSARLGEICDIQSGGTPPRSRSDYYGGNIPWAKISDLETADGTVFETEEHVTMAGLAAIRGRIFPKGTLLFAMYGSIGKMAFAGRDLATNQAILGIQVSDTARTLSRYLYHWLNANKARLLYAGQGITQKNLSATYLRDLVVPLPLLDEQRRIAAILDQVDDLRYKRRVALQRVAELPQAIFYDTFGDPVTNLKQWPKKRFSELLTFPLRNGVSPSSAGQLTIEVLTLSSITGHRFKADAIKPGLFLSSPPESQRVTVADLLICRGNGNKDLVGRGFFPPRDMPTVVFPDTVIAARVDTHSVVLSFLELLWNLPSTRSQIERRARTTNGTFKINQAALEDIELIVPPLPLQNSFAKRVTAINSLASTAFAQETRLDLLFASLQHRAFEDTLTPAFAEATLASV